MKNIEIKKTLNMINIILLTAQINDEKESEKITQSISDYLKYISLDVNTVNLKNEICTLREFLSILSKRFCFKYNCECLNNEHYYIKHLSLIEFFESYLIEIIEKNISIELFNVIFNIENNELIATITMNKYNEYDKLISNSDTFRMNLEVK